MPFTVIALTNIKNEKRASTIIDILIFVIIGITISPIITWITSVLYEKLESQK